jgi:hypothetical protein
LWVNFGDLAPPYREGQVSTSARCLGRNEKPSHVLGCASQAQTVFHQAKPAAAQVLMKLENNFDDL